MGIKKFIANVIELLELDDFENSGKKKSVKRLLGKLKARKEILDKDLKKKINKREKKETKEELAIVTAQIKKAEKILDKLNKKKENKTSKTTKEK